MGFSQIPSPVEKYAVVTSSTRPSSPTEGQSIYETDTDRWLVYDGSNWTLSKASAGPYICTSSTRPTLGLFEGLMIYETDTNRIYTYDGSAWFYQAGGQDPTFASAYRVAAFSCTSGSIVRIPFDTEFADYGSNHSAGVYTCPTNGVYSVMGRYGIDAAATNDRFICSVIKNGTTEHHRGNDISIGTVGNVGVTVAAEVICVAGDTLGVGAFQVAGTSRAIAIGSQYAWGQFRRVSG
jgi:hypothetical protein